MFYCNLFRDEGDGGGTGAGGGASQDAAGFDSSSKAGGSDGASGGTEGGTANNAAGKDSTKKTDATNSEPDWKAELAKFKDENAQLKKKMGKQGEEVGTWRKVLEGLEHDPDATLSFLAKKAGRKYPPVDTSKENKEITKALLSDDSEVRAQVAAQREKEDFRQSIMRDIKTEWSPAMETMLEETMARKHPDWDSFTDDRYGLKAQVVTGKMPERELFHLAARGANMPEIIAEAKKEAIAEYVQSLQKKNDGQIDLEGGGGDSKPKGKVSIAFAEVAQAIGKVR
jgi:hypothetical protein